MYYFQITAEYTKHDMNEKIHIYMDKCLDDPKMKITDDMKEKIRKHEKIDEEMMMKISRCMMTKVGYMNEAGEVMKDAMKKEIATKMRDPTKFDQMMDTCYKIMDTPGKTAMNMIGCARDYHDRNCGC